jgi:hypothetical protein
MKARVVAACRSARRSIDMTPLITDAALVDIRAICQCPVRRLMAGVEVVL